MKSPIKIALLAALAVEAVNLRAFPIDVGYPPDTPWYINLIGDQWVILHLAGLRLMHWFDTVGFKGHEGIALFLGGYIETALLLIAIILGFQWLINRGRTETPKPSQGRPNALPKVGAKSEG